MCSALPLPWEVFFMEKRGGGWFFCFQIDSIFSSCRFWKNCSKLNITSLSENALPKKVLQ